MGKEYSTTSLMDWAKENNKQALYNWLDEDNLDILIVDGTVWRYELTTRFSRSPSERIKCDLAAFLAQKLDEEVTYLYTL